LRGAAASVSVLVKLKGALAVGRSVDVEEDDANLSLPGSPHFRTSACSELSTPQD
jgi:hypothetical protein